MNVQQSQEWTESDRKVVLADLGREPRGVVAVAARRVDGRPQVLATAPRLPDGTPFPTAFYLTDPELVDACSRLEAEHFMDELAQRLATDSAFRADYESAHADYLARREELGRLSGVGSVPEIDGFSAGGMPARVKCLHALVGHSLAAGPGFNPAGDAALEEIGRRGLAEVAMKGLPWPRTDRPRYAAIDCGTNSIRLLIAELSTTRGDRELRDVQRDMVITRLGAGVDRTGELSVDAVDRTVEVARQYAAAVAAEGAQALRVVATSATRDATNRDYFREEMLLATGVEPEVITGEEEAALSYLGALTSLPGGLAGPFLVVDIGGGSTEFVLGLDQVEQSVSIDMGSVRVTERFGPEPWDAHKKAEARAWIDNMLDRAQESVDLAAARTLVGLAGTVTSLAGWIYGVQTYSPEITHGSKPETSRWVDALTFFVDEPVSVKAASPAVPPGRADVIAGGALIWERILLRLGVLAQEAPEEGSEQVLVPGPRATDVTVVVSEHDILDGLVLSMRS